MSEAAGPQSNIDLSELAGRVDRLSLRVEAVAALVENLTDHLAAPRAAAPLTSEDLADIAARMVRLIESRLQTHDDRLVETISQLFGELDVEEIDLTESKDQLALIDDHLALVGRAVLEVKNAVSSSGGTYDRAVLQQVTDRLEEASVRVAERVDEQLATRVQRFEALSQSMMSLVGDPIDALTERIQELTHLREPSAALLEQITALRQEGLEREALLRHVVARLEELGHTLAPSASPDSERNKLVS